MLLSTHGGCSLFEYVCLRFASDPGQNKQNKNRVPSAVNNSDDPGVRRGSGCNNTLLFPAAELINSLSVVSFLCFPVSSQIRVQSLRLWPRYLCFFGPPSSCWKVTGSSISLRRDLNHVFHPNNGSHGCYTLEAVGVGSWFCFSSMLQILFEVSFFLAHLTDFFLMQLSSW